MREKGAEEMICTTGSALSSASVDVRSPFSWLFVRQFFCCKSRESIFSFRFPRRLLTLCTSWYSVPASPYSSLYLRPNQNRQFANPAWTYYPRTQILRLANTQFPLCWLSINLPVKNQIVRISGETRINLFQDQLKVMGYGMACQAGYYNTMSAKIDFCPIYPYSLCLSYTLYRVLIR